MPAFYAHRYFGEQVRKLFPAPLQEVCQTHENAFLLGTQGPDVLFYHKPFKANATRSKGMELHLQSAKIFFKACRQKAVLNGEWNEIRAYVAGFICHFMLDNACHPHIYVLEDKGVPHGRIESEFDKYIKRQKGMKVHKNAAAPLRPTTELARAVASILEVEESEVKRSVKTMRFINGLFSVNSKAFHRLAHWVLKKKNMQNGYGSMFLHFTDHPDCNELNPVLFKNLENAIEPTATVVAQFFTKDISEDFFGIFDKDYKGESLL